MSERPGVKGLDQVMGNLNRHLAKVEGATLGGLFAGGLIIEAEAKRNTPVLTGNLKGSGSTRKSPEEPKTIEVVFTAAYAIYVHENLEAHHSNGTAKFLENAARDKHEEVLTAVRAYAKKVT